MCRFTSNANHSTALISFIKQVQHWGRCLDGLAQMGGLFDAMPRSITLSC